MTPTASLIIPSYKGETKLPVLLEALRHQDTDDFEAIVVIDGRLDDSEQLIASASQDIPVRALVLEENQGRVTALNAGFAASRGDVLIRCDDDLELAPNFVSAHVKRHRGSEKPIGVVGLTRDVLGNTAYARAYGNDRTRGALRSSYAGSIPAWRHWAANCSVSRPTWESIGPYSTAYGHYGWEDVDYGYRLHESGIPVVIAPELETVHLGAAANADTRVRRAYQSGAARRTFESLHPEALRPPTSGEGLWGRAVSATSSLRSERRFHRLAQLADSLLPVVPSAIGEKIVALAVESASLAGYSNPDSVATRF